MLELASLAVEDAAMNRIFRFRSLVMERVWGGRALHDMLGRELPGEAPCGESWDIVDRPEAQSVVSGGALAGMTLEGLLQDHGREVMGRDWKVGRRFPILVKWLDCRERLSLQVHPPPGVAGELGGEPKTENWYIADCDPQARLIVGLRHGVTRAEFERALRDETLEGLVHSFPVAAGDSILVESGRLHAIDGGNLILEIQQNSDTTYRVYDWGRVGLDGKPRMLHVEQSLRSIDFEDFEPEPVRAVRRDRVLADCGEFRITQRVIAEGADFRPGEENQAVLLHVVEGGLSFPDTGDGDVELVRGDNVLMPAGFTGAGQARGEAVVLVTDRFGGDRDE